MPVKKKSVGRQPKGADARNITVSVKMSENEIADFSKRGVTLRSLIDNDKAVIR